MRHEIPLGRLFGTDVYARPGFFLLLAFPLLTWGGDRLSEAALYCLALVLTLLVHEFGHVFAVRWWTGGPSIVVLWMLGGLCLHARVQRPGAQIGIALMGPAFGFVLGFAALAACFLPGMHDLVRSLLWYVAVVGIVLNAANLLPIVPLDGGQAFRALLKTTLDPVRADRIARVVSIGCAAGGVAAGLAFGYHFAAILAGMLLLANLNQDPVAYH